MIFSITVILVFQLAGEVIARAFELPVPGPVIGMGLLLAAFVAIRPLADRVVPTAQNILAHLSLLFVPAGVGVISHVDVLGQDGFALLIALVLSTLLALGAGVLTFMGLARLTGSTEESPE